MAPTAYTNVLLQEAVRDGVMLDVKIQGGWVGGSGALTTLVGLTDERVNLWEGICGGIVGEVS